MPPQPLETDVEPRDGLAVVRLRGEIDGFADEALAAAYDQAEALAPAVLLDFAGVDYINSTGIALVIGLLKKARAAGARLAAFALSDHYTEIFTIARLTDYLPLFPDEGAAIQGIAGLAGGDPAPHRVSASGG